MKRYISPAFDRTRTPQSRSGILKIPSHFVPATVNTVVMPIRRSSDVSFYFAAPVLNPDAFSGDGLIEHRRDQ